MQKKRPTSISESSSAEAALPPARFSVPRILTGQGSCIATTSPSERNFFLSFVLRIRRFTWQMAVIFGSNRLRTWLQFLAFLVVALFSVMAQASAHGGPDSDWPGHSQFSSEDADQTKPSGPTYFENSTLPIGHCKGLCCCDGPSHCAPCGPTSSALNEGGEAISHVPVATRIGFPWDTGSHTLDRKFGLERPPRV
jgi:hypothetical protein